MSDCGWTFQLDLLRSGELFVSGVSAEFWVGDVPGCDEAPPDFCTDPEATIRAALASWNSPFEPVHARFLDPEV
ncbi:hypothetical protein ABZ816_37390 [Actinosynnema sp. NPDC047251]|uniref:hypothetical protein n=1 Tax=Saccharothrix espanaensis TaxID=103731 RepID=UPI00031632FA|nr:hypothetical protein [Saccharothrix espanaensis]